MNDKTPREILQEKDEVTLVDGNGELLGRKDKIEAHKHPVPLHLASSVWLFNTKNQVLLQKRSPKKILGSGWWANTVCGNVRPTETYYDCAHRRLKQELGITNQQIQPAYKFTYKAYCDPTYGEHEIDQVYLGLYSKNAHAANKILFNLEEVSDIRWVDFDSLVAQTNLVQYPAPEQTLLQESQELAELTPPVSISVKSEKGDEMLLLAPWAVFMLRSPQFSEAAEQLQIA